MKSPDDEQPISEPIEVRIAKLGAEFRLLERAERLARESAEHPDPEPLDPRLVRLGDHFRALEDAKRRERERLALGEIDRPRPEARQRPSRRPASEGRALRGPMRGKVAPLIAVLSIAASGVVVGLELASPAGASSPVSRAPALAERAGSVRFRSTVNVILGGQPLARFSETGAVSFSTSDFESTLAIGGGGETVQRRRVGPVIYARALPGHTGHGRGVQWRGLRPRRTSRAKPNFAYLQIDPQTVLTVLDATHESPVVVGHGTLAGTAATHYRVATTLGAFLATAQHVRASTQARETSVAGTLDVWLDRRGRPLRVSASFSTADRTGPVTMTIVTTFVDYGVPVRIMAPRGAPVSASQSTSPDGPLGGDPILVLERILFASQLATAPRPR
jgi:hypothetical protein